MEGVKYIDTYYTTIRNISTEEMASVPEDISKDRINDYIKTQTHYKDTQWFLEKINSLLRRIKGKGYLRESDRIELLNIVGNAIVNEDMVITD